MALTVTLTLQDVYTRVVALVADVVPLGTKCIQGLGNRVSWPSAAGFVAITATLLKPLRTPVTTWDMTDIDPNLLTIEQGTKIRVQIDCYGPNSADWAVMLMTVLRSDYGALKLAPGVVPLYADDPLQAALTDGEEQYTERWIVGANLQYNPAVTVPMQFADELVVGLINVDERYPP